MNIGRDQFWEDVDSGEVHIRDKMQFALKSDFFPQSGAKKSLYIQEFYLFIPNSLQINSDTYTRTQFFIDQTSLIRYKTPIFTLQDLLDKNNDNSPLKRILALTIEKDTHDNREKLSDELKLLANILRSTLRRESKQLIALLQSARVISEYSKEFIHSVHQLCSLTTSLKAAYATAQHNFLDHWNDMQFYRQMLYIDEFMTSAVSHYFGNILENLRLTSHEHLMEADRELCEILLLEQKRIDDDIAALGAAHPDLAAHNGENIIYRSNLLDKFVLDALQLLTNRFSLDQRFQHWIGGISAAIAMMIYFSLYVWLWGVFVINSEPFILLMVVIYVLKDRIKEWIRSVSYQQATRWFPDYTTRITSTDKKQRLGFLKESFSFLEENQLPHEIKDIRNAEFHAVLQTFQRPESVLFYKQVVQINQIRNALDERLSGLNVIFRLNIHRFIRQATDPIENHLTIDPATKKLHNLRLPKVYHLNLIIRSTSSNKDNSPTIEVKKLRLIVDKNGIKRIEQIDSY